MRSSPGDAVALNTLCEARTRVVSAFGDDPQDTKLKLATTSTTGKKADFFKREAPNYRKTRDLSAKYGIIAERRNSPALGPKKRLASPCRMQEAALILYSD